MEDVNKMSGKRMGEIAIKLVRANIKEERVVLDAQEFKKKVAATAKHLNITNEEALQFVFRLTKDAFEELAIDVANKLEFYKCTKNEK